MNMNMFRKQINTTGAKNVEYTDTLLEIKHATPPYPNVVKSEVTSPDRDMLYDVIMFARTNKPGIPYEYEKYIASVFRALFDLPNRMFVPKTLNM